MPRGGKLKNPLPFKSPGRFPKPIDWNLVDHLLQCGCTGMQIAARLDMHHQTFFDRVVKDKGCQFTIYAASKRQKGETLLLEKQFQIAMEGDRTLLIWLGKNRLKQVDKQPEERATETLGLIQQLIERSAGKDIEFKAEPETV